MALTLSEPPGFCDLDDQVLAQENTAYAIHAGRIGKNSEFGVDRLEIFTAIYLNGETVAPPTSLVDGYNYSLAECVFFWNLRNTASAQRGGNNPVVLTDPAGNISTTGWMSPATLGQSLWFLNVNVQQYDRSQSADSPWNQKAGLVNCEEWYRRSGDDSQKIRTNDGIVQVWIIGQRLKNQLQEVASPTWANIDETQIAQDKPWRMDLAQQLNENAKFSVLNTEVFYLGEYVNGDTVSLTAALSQVDSYQYSVEECKFMHAWRWTARADSYLQPRDSLGQMGPFSCTVDESGAVSIYVDFIDDGGALEQHPEFGRVAVFGFCTRADGPTAITPTADQFRQLDDNFFAPGEALRASTVLAIKRNIDQAVLTPEYFGPTLYGNGETVALPTSPVDGYVYSREELMYVYTWDNTLNQTGNNLRLPFFAGKIDQATGVASLAVFRLPPGGPYVDDNNSLAKFKVLVVAFRGAELPELIDVPVNPPEDQPPSTDVQNLFGAVPAAEVDLAPSGPGDFTVAHSFGGTPALVMIQMTSGGNIWFQAATRYDGTNLYLTASDAGVTAKALLFDTAPEAEVALAPAADGNFGVSHSLGAVPGLLLIQMTSGGNIWGQNPSEADDKFLYLTASGLSLTGNAELWLALTGEATPSMKWKSIPISSTAPGNFEVQHEIGETPKAVLINMNTPGFPAFWFQTARYDDVKIYLVAPDAGVSGFAEVLY